MPLPLAHGRFRSIETLHRVKTGKTTPPSPSVLLRRLMSERRDEEVRFLFVPGRLFFFFSSFTTPLTVFRRHQAPHRFIQPLVKFTHRTFTFTLFSFVFRLLDAMGGVFFVSSPISSSALGTVRSPPLKPHRDRACLRVPSFPVSW